MLPPIVNADPGDETSPDEADIMFSAKYTDDELADWADERAERRQDSQYEVSERATIGWPRPVRAGSW